MPDGARPSEDREEPSWPAESPGFLASLRAGFLAASPLLIGLVPFALIYGAAAKESGLSLGQTCGMSLMIFAGSAQLVFVNLYQEGVNALALILACLAVNLRLLIYASSLSSYLGPPKGFLSGLLRSYILTDESYAVSLSRFLRPGFGWPRAPFYLGASLPTWLGWQIMGLAGYLSASAMPKSLPLGMAIPMVFLALLVSLLKSAKRPDLAGKLAAALAAGLAALALGDFPLKLGLILAILIGVGAGLAISRAKAGREGPRGREGS
jgi:predicted branched-subunit amino acid permease